MTEDDDKIDAETEAFYSDMYGPAAEAADRVIDMRNAVEIVEMEWSCALALQLMKKAAKKRSAGEAIDVNEYFLDLMNIKKHAAIAWKGYQLKGRGAVVTRIHFPDNDASKAVIGQSLEYLSENELLINGWSGAPVDEVRICDPETEVVVLAIWPDGAVSICRSGPHPEHFFQASDQ